MHSKTRLQKLPVAKLSIAKPMEPKLTENVYVRDTSELLVYA